MTLIRQDEEINEIVLRTPTELLSTLEYVTARTLVISWAWIGEEMVRNSCQQTDGEWDKTAEDMILNFAESGHPGHFVPAAPWKDESWRAKEKEKRPFTSTVAMTPLNWFFEQLFPSMDSVSAEQWRICVKN